MINLDKIQSMWQEDCKIDIDNMHEESIKIPQLHSKYHEMLNNLILLRTNAQKIQKSGTEDDEGAPDSRADDKNGTLVLEEI